MWQLSAASTLAALIGLLPMPYGFYMILRVTLCLTAAVGFVKALGHQQKLWLWVYGLFAVIYNPILPVHLGDKNLWVIINLVTLVFFWTGVVRVRDSAKRITP